MPHAYFVLKMKLLTISFFIVVWLSCLAKYI
jgi:hypothetical protein